MRHTKKVSALIGGVFVGATMGGVGVISALAVAAFRPAAMAGDATISDRLPYAISSAVLAVVVISLAALLGRRGRKPRSSSS